MSLSDQKLHNLAHDWYDAWNSRDAKAICALYADDIEFTSPFIIRTGMAEDGLITGIQTFFQYVQNTLPRVPNLKFEPIANCLSIAGTTLVYRNQSGHIVAEAHQHDEDGLIRVANAAYSTSPLKRTSHAR
jgi:hypothetical protein